MLSRYRTVPLETTAQAWPPEGAATLAGSGSPMENPGHTVERVTRIEPAFSAWEA